MKAIDNGNGKLILPEGKHEAILYSIIDMGTQEGYQGAMKRQYKFTFECPNTTSEFNGIERPLVIGLDINMFFNKDGTLYVSDKSKLYDVAYNAFDIKIDKDTKLEELLGKVCKLKIENVKAKKSGNLYAKIVGFTENEASPKQHNESVFFSLDNFDELIFEKLPQWIKDSIMNTDEYRNIKGPVEEKDSIEDDLPF